MRPESETGNDAEAEAETDNSNFIDSEVSPWPFITRFSDYYYLNSACLIYNDIFILLQNISL